MRYVRIVQAMRSARAVRVLCVSLAVIILFSICGSAVFGRSRRQIEGFRQYTSGDKSIILQYPPDWIVVDKNTEQSILEGFGNRYGIAMDAFDQDLQRYAVIIYAADEHDFLASVSVAKSTELKRGVSNRLLRDESFKTAYDSSVEAIFLRNGRIAEIVQEARDDEFNGQYFMTAKVMHRPFSRGDEMIMYQAMTIENGTMYTFNLAAKNSETVDFDAIAGNFEKILGSTQLR